MWKNWWAEPDLDEPTRITDQVYLQRESETNKIIVPVSFQHRHDSEFQQWPPGTTWQQWSHDMQKKVLNDTANWHKKQQIDYAEYPHHAWMTTNSETKHWRQSENSLKFASKSSWNARTQLTSADRTSYELLGKSCDEMEQGMRQGISQTKSVFFHHTGNFRQCCPFDNKASGCKLGLFQDADFGGDLTDSKSSGGVLPMLESQTFVTISWTCKKQNAVSHSSTEAEVISLDAGLRMEGLLAFVRQTKNIQIRTGIHWLCST